MGYYDYGEVRWKLLCSPQPDPTEKKAIEELYGVVRTYLPYILTVCTDPAEITPKDHVIYIGTTGSNPVLLQLAERGAYRPTEKREGYSIRVSPAADRPGMTDIILQGADPTGVLYAVYEFEHAYLDDKLKYEGYHFEDRFRPFVDPCPEFETAASPGIVNRGLWSWGHKIYDYRAYLDNMARCRLNMLVMWNDLVPVNAKELLEYAHLNGIRVIWGFTCAWGEDITVDPLDPAEAERWGKRVLDIYEREYAPLGGDGVYFQCFTESNNLCIKDVPVAKLATDWINHMVGVLHAAHPELYIQFGIHASSIRENLGMMSTLSPHTTPMWEDCGGFPFHYDPRQGDIPQTLAYSRRLIEMAKPNGRFGVVLKGFTVLPWKAFEHYKGNILAGKTDAVYRKRALEDRRFYWRFCEPYWINHAPELKAFCTAVADAGFADSTVTALVEDGLFEEELSPSVGIYAELLWDPQADIPAVIEKIYHSEHFGH